MFASRTSSDDNNLMLGTLMEGAARSVSRPAAPRLLSPRASRHHRRLLARAPALPPRHSSCIYLDYNATTPVYSEVLEALLPYLTSSYGNPSSSHAHGRPCREAVATARRQVAGLVGASPEEVVFTSCGTESDNWALHAATSAWREEQGSTPHVVTSAVEHPAVLEYLAAQARAGLLTYTAVAPDADGSVPAAALAAAAQPHTALLSLMHANNETGALNDVAAAGRAVRAVAPKARVHTDAAQSCGRVPVNVKALGVDYLTLVGHKMGAPKGVAALYVRSGAPLPRLLHGGGQESGRRAGTECVPLLVGLGAACELASRNAAGLQRHTAALRDALQATLTAALGGPDGEGVRVHGCGPHGRLPNTLSISLRDCDAGALLRALGDEVAASAGSACHAGGKSASPVLSAMGVPLEYALGTLRLSVGRHTTFVEVEAAAELLVEAALLQRASREAEALGR